MSWKHPGPKFFVALAVVILCGAADAELTVTAYDYPDTVDAGDIISFIIEICNGGEAPDSFNKIGFLIEGPINAKFLYFSGPTLTLPPGGCVSVMPNFHIPEAAPPGLYTITVLVGLDTVEKCSCSFDIVVRGEMPELDHFGLFACDGSGSGWGKSCLVVYDSETDSTWQVDLGARSQGVGYTPAADLVVCAARDGDTFIIETETWTISHTVTAGGGVYPGDGVDFSEDGSLAVIHEKSGSNIWIFPTEEPPAWIEPHTFTDPLEPSIDELITMDDMVYMIDYANDLLWYFDISDPAGADTLSIPGDGLPLKPTAMALDTSGDYLVVLTLGSGPYFGCLSFFDITGGAPLPIGWISCNTGNPTGDLNFRGPTDLDIALSTEDFEGASIAAGDAVAGIIGENSGTPGGCAGVFNISAMLDRELGVLLVSSLSELLDLGAGFIFTPFPGHISAQPISDCALSPDGIFLSASEIGATSTDVTTAEITSFDILIEGAALTDPDDVTVLTRPESE